MGCFSKPKVNLSFYIIEPEEEGTVDLSASISTSRGQHSPHQRWLVKDAIMILYYRSDDEAYLIKVAACLLLQGPEGKPGPPGNRGRHGKKVRTAHVCVPTLKLRCGWLITMCVSLLQQYSVSSQGERGLPGPLGEVGERGDVGQPGELGPKGARGTRGAPVSARSCHLSFHLIVCLSLICSNTCFHWQHILTLSSLEEFLSALNCIFLPWKKGKCPSRNRSSASLWLQGHADVWVTADSLYCCYTCSNKRQLKLKLLL